METMPKGSKPVLQSGVHVACHWDGAAGGQFKEKDAGEDCIPLSPGSGESFTV